MKHGHVEEGQRDGHADLSYVYQAARDIAPLLENYTVIVDKSTVPIGTARNVKRIITEVNPDAECVDIESIPAEWCPEGTAFYHQEGNERCL